MVGNRQSEGEKSPVRTCCKMIRSCVVTGTPAPSQHPGIIIILQQYTPDCFIHHVTKEM